MSNPEPLATLQHEHIVNTLKFARKGQILVVGSSDRLVTVWRTMLKMPFFDIKGFKEIPTSLEIDAKEDFFVVGCADGKAYLFGLGHGHFIKECGQHSGAITAVAISDDGKNIITGGADSKVKVWEKETANLVHEFQDHKDSIQGMAIVEDFLVTISKYGALSPGTPAENILIYNWRSGKLIKKIEEHTNAVNVVAISPNNKYFFTAGADLTIKKWNLKEGTLQFSIENAHDLPIRALQVTADGSTLISGGEDGKIKFWNTRRGKSINEFQAHDKAVLGLAYEFHQNTLASGSDDHSIKIWELLNFL